MSPELVFLIDRIFLFAWRLRLNFILFLKSGCKHLKHAAVLRHITPSCGSGRVLNSSVKKAHFGKALCISIRLSFSSREMHNFKIADLLGLLSCFVPGDACYSYLSRARENLVIWGNDHIGPLAYGNKTLILGAIFSSLFVALSQYPLMTSFSLVNFYLWEKRRKAKLRNIRGFWSTAFQIWAVLTVKFIIS